MQEENKQNEWLRQRQILAWEPEIVISGAVLWGLLQLPEQVNHFIVYLNDWGPAVFLVSDIDELLAAFMKTSIYLLVAGLIVNLLMRAVWVVMIGMSYAFPAGLSLEKFRFQRYFHDKMAALPSLEKQVVRLDRLCSVIYATTFLLFMCLVGAFFFVFVYGGAFLMLYHYWPNKSREVIEQLNALLNISIVFLALTYFLDFITLGSGSSALSGMLYCIGLFMCL